MRTHTPLPNESQLDQPGLKAIAQKLSFDEHTFQSCLACGESKSQVLRDQEDGRKAGISSTLGFFINSIPLAGAQAENAFEKVIDEELKTTGNQSVVRASR